jgi:sugar lactone lactonase YvrE
VVVGCGGDGTGPPSNATLTSLAITPEVPSIEPGTDQQFTATGTFSDGSTSNATNTVTWASSNTAALTISNAAGTRGLARRISDASVEVTATMGAIAASVRVSVWCTTIASAFHFDGDVAGTGTGFAIGRLAGDAGAVYWAGFDGSAGGSDGYIAGVAKAGGTALTLASNLGGINDLASDGSHVYWTEFDLGSGNGRVKRVPVTGGAVDVLASGIPAGSTFDVFFPLGIAVDADFVYWGEEVAGGAIRRVPKGGGSVTDLARGGGFGPSSIEIGGSFLYGVANGPDVAARLPLAGGTVETLASGLGNPEGTALDGQALYWSELVGEPDGRIARVPLGGGPVTVLATGLDNPRGIALWNDQVYYNGASGAGAARRAGVWRVPAGGGSSTLVVEACGIGQGGAIDGLAVDATHIFYVDTGSPGRVLRAPRQ